jgi:hypothetical protein
MGQIESDPRDVNYIALLVAIKWYEEISSEIAIRIAKGSSHRKPGRHLTPEILKEIKRLMASPNFTSVDTVVRKCRINKYEILEAITGDKDAEGEVIKMLQAEKLLTRLKGIAENCAAANCEKCPLDKIMCGELTLCEVLSDTAVDGQGKLSLKRVRQVSDKCPTVEELTGEVVKKTYRIYKQADDEIHRYIEKYPRQKAQDIVSLALLEYANKHT